MIPPLAFLDGFGGGEMMWIMLIALLLFGGDKLPGLAKGMGKAIREFKKAASEVEHEIKRAIEEAPETSTSKPPNALPPNPTPAPSTVAFPPSAGTADPDGAYPYGSEHDLSSAKTTAPAPDAPPPSAPEPKPPGDQPPTPPEPLSPYEHLNDL
jgi:sec-independent protein translocase protein TatA